MLKKTIKYEDYDGNKREEEFYFNLSKAELVEMGLSQDGGLDKFLKRIIQEQNAPEIVKMLKTILRKAYGEKSDDGKVLLKSDEISHKFECTEAYSDLFMEIFSTPEAAIAFFTGIMPSDMRAEIEKNMREEVNVQQG
ncbi:MAG: hypothetical protein IKO19_02685 [Candidatus Riflebacteria bacterium]|nr:hypothetical protein [Candidatus Riflebacteria bacterium]